MVDGVGLEFFAPTERVTERLQISRRSLFVDCVWAIYSAGSAKQICPPYFPMPIHITLVSPSVAMHGETLFG